MRTNIIANVLGRGWEVAMSVAFVPVYINRLGPEAYGVIGTVAVIQAFMTILDFGMTPTLTREAARFEAGEHDTLHMRDLLRSVELIVGGVGGAIVVAMFGAASFISAQWVRAGALDEGVIRDALTIAGALIALRFVESIYRGTLYGLQRQLLCNGLAAAMATLRGGGAVALLLLADADLRGFFAWQAVVSLLSVLAMRSSVSFALPRTDRRPRFSREALRGIGRFATGMVLISLLSLAATQVDKVILLRLIPLEQFGYYAFAINLAVMLELATMPVMTALQPRIVAYVSTGDEAGLRRLFRQWARILATITAPVAALLIFFAPTLIMAWSHNLALAERSGAFAATLAIGYFLHAQCVLPYYVQLGYGWTRLSILLNSAALVVTVPSLILLVPRLGPMAAAWTWVAVATLYLGVGLQIMFRRYLRTERWRFFLVDAGPPAAAGFAVMAGCKAILGEIPPTWLGQIIQLAIAFGLSLSAAAVCAYAIARRDPVSTASE